MAARTIVSCDLCNKDVREVEKIMFQVELPPNPQRWMNRWMDICDSCMGDVEWVMIGGAAEAKAKKHDPTDPR